MIGNCGSETDLSLARQSEENQQKSYLDSAQRQVVARYLHYLLHFDPEGDYCDAFKVKEALAMGWAKYLL